MSSYKKIPVTVNVETCAVIDASNGDRILKTELLPSLFYGETAVLCVSFVDSNLQAVQLQDSDTFELSVNKDFDHTQNSLMCYSGNAMVDIASDWAEASRTDGKISIRINCFTSMFAQKLGSAESIRALLEIKRFSAGSTSPSVMLLNEITARNVIHLDETAPEGASVDYYTAAQTDALFSAGLELQFSADESAWHSTFTVNDKHYRIRLATGNAPWSPSIPIPQGSIEYRAYEYAFTTASGIGDTITFSKETLELSTEPDVSLWQVLGNGNRQKIQSGIASFIWGTDGLTIGYYQGFPEGSWIIKA